MKIFEIYDNENVLSIGVLLYYEKEKTFIIELQEYLDEWNAPLLFSSLVKRGIYSVPRNLSLTWVQGRIIPPGRQNISSILSTHKLKEYDEMKFLEISEGRCSQDNMYIRKLEVIPPFLEERMNHNLLDCTPIGNHNLLCFFRDNTVKKISLTEFTTYTGIDKVLANDLLFKSCRLGTDGFYITFNNSIDIPSWTLYEKGQLVPIEYEDFLSFINNNLVDTSASCALLECSRQNLAYMVGQDQLHPVKENVKGNLYLKKDVLGNMW